MKKRIAGGFTLIELMVVVAIIGILAAVAIPAFMKNAKKAKTTEATINVKKLADGAMSYYHEEKNKAGSATPIAKQFPDVGAGGALVTVPAAGACCAGAITKCQPNPTLWTDPGWQALKFSMDDPHYYSYGYVRNAAGGSTAAQVIVAVPGGGSIAATEFFFADAFGDLNCDGTFSTFEMNGGVMADGSISTGAGLYSDKELD